jgi:hypothetical protein
LSLVGVSLAQFCEFGIDILKTRIDAGQNPQRLGDGGLRTRCKCNALLSIFLLPLAEGSAIDLLKRARRVSRTSGNTLACKDGSLAGAKPSIAAVDVRKAARSNPEDRRRVGTAKSTRRRWQMQNKLRFVRVRPSGLMSRTGKIFVDLKAPAINCDIVDISAGGACIIVHGASEIPRKFILLYGGVKKNCRAVWIKGRRVGLSF